MIIYKAKNTINKKVYIGQTVKNLDYRKQGHINSAKRDSNFHFHNALRKYGFDNFEWGILEKVNYVKELDIREDYWINYYNSVEEGYNMVEGLKNPMHSKKVKYRHSKVVKSQKFRSKVSKTMKKLRKNGNFGEEHLAKISRAMKGNENGKRVAVKMYSIDNKFIKQFDTIQEGVKYLKKHYGMKKSVGSHISARINNKKYLAYGFIWKHVNEGAETIEFPLLKGLVE